MPLIYETRGRAREYSHLACNLYYGCTHRCSYCYAQDFKFNNVPEVTPKPDVIAQLTKESSKYSNTDKRVLLCFTCDPYPPIEIEQGLTRQALQIFRNNNIPFQILTKAGLKAGRDFDLYGDNDAYATTLTFITERLSLQYEPGAAVPIDRIAAIRKAKKMGINTWVSLEPVIDADESLRLIESTHSFVDLFKIGKLNHKESDIDWRDFGIKAIELCNKYNKQYYIKQDLIKYLDGMEINNTDTRTVKGLFV